MAALLSFVETVSPALGWVTVVGACMAGVFLLYVGAAVAVALFHPKREMRRHAAGVLRQLLDFVRRTAR